jgi:hypothetical protein
MGFFKTLRLWLKRKSTTATIVEDEKTDASTQRSVEELESQTQTDGGTDSNCAENIDEIESIKAYYEYLILQKDEVIRLLISCLQQPNAQESQVAILN